MLKTLIIAGAIAATIPALSWAQVPTKTAGGVLTNASGMTLYTFDKDAGGKSACTGACLGNWPPLSAAADAKAAADYTVMARDDGIKQWAYKGKPLYTWVKDSKPGDKTGEGMANGAWHAAKP